MECVVFAYKNSALSLANQIDIHHFAVTDCCGNDVSEVLLEVVLGSRVGNRLLLNSSVKLQVSFRVLLSLGNENDISGDLLLSLSAMCVSSLY